MVARLRQGRRSLDERADEIGLKLSGDLAKARQMLGLSKGQLAKELSVSVKIISDLEKGSGSMETLIVVMDAVKYRLAGIGPGYTLAEQLAKRRAKLKLSAEQVAAKTQLSEATVTDLEKGSGAVRELFRLFALIAPKVRGFTPERAYWSQAQKTGRDSRFTPATFMAAIYDAFGDVDIDPCAHRKSPVIASRRIILTEGGDGLVDAWSGRLAFVNPPFSGTMPWTKRAYEEWAAGNVQTVLCLLPVRTDNKFFHETLHKDADLFLLKGRLRFASEDGDVQPTPFSLWLVALGATAEQKRRFAELVPGCWFRATTFTAVAHNIATSCRAIDRGLHVCCARGDQRRAVSAARWRPPAHKTAAAGPAHRQWLIALEPAEGNESG